MTQLKNGKIDDIDINSLIESFSTIINVDIQTFKGSSRVDKLPFLRYIFCYCIREVFKDVTFADIGGIFGKKHSNTYIGISKVKNALLPPRPDKEVMCIINSFLPFCKLYKE